MPPNTDEQRTSSGEPEAAPATAPADNATHTADPSATASPESVPSTSAPAYRASDRYDILGEHGRGGLGRVSRAHDRELDRDVAIKELLNRTHVSEVRFFREALITARLEHPGIVPVHEAGRWPDGTPFYAMKLVAGRPLRELIAERHTVAERLELLHHVIAVADAIAYAHGRNIIHRDLKPANVIVGDFGETIVIDWGLAKDLSISDEPSLADSSLVSSRNADLTSTGTILGTPSYMAPEQARGEHVDQRADVFAIGAMLWELCSLQKVPPTDRHERHRLLRRSSIDRDLVAIVDKALQDDPARRYQDAAALAADLKAFKAGVRIAARDYSLLEMLSRWSRRHRALTLSILLALLGAASGTAIYLHSVTAERNRADNALEHVETTKRELDRQHGELILKHVELLLTKDPTAAVETLGTYHGDRHDRANQLRAEALGRGVAVMRASPHTDNILWARGTRDGGVVTLSVDGTIARTKDGQQAEILARNISSKLAWSYSDQRHLLAYSCSSTRICLFNILTNTQQTFALGPDGTPNKIAFSPSGNRLATITNAGQLRVFDVAGPQHVEIFSAKTGGRYVMAAGEASYVIGVDGGLMLVTQNKPNQPMSVPDGIDWDADTTGDHLAMSTSAGAVSLIDTATFHVTKSQLVCRASVGRVLFLPGHSSIVYACNDGQLGLWYPEEGRATKLLQLKGAPLVLAVSTEGEYIIAADRDLSINVLDLETGVIAAYQGESLRTSSLTAPTAEYPFIITGDAFGNIRVWPVPRRAAKVVAHVDGRFTSAIMQHDTLLALTRTFKFVSFDPQRGQTTWPSHYKDDFFLEQAADSGAVATYGFSSKARLWEDRELTHATEIDSAGSTISQLKALPNNHWISADEAGHLTRWSSQGTPESIDDRHQAITSIIVTNNKLSVVAATIDGAIWYVDLTQHQPVKQLRGPGSRITSMVMFPDGDSVALGQANGDLDMLDLHGRAPHTLLHTNSAIRDIVFEPEGNTLAIATSKDQVFLGIGSGKVGSTAIEWSELAAQARHIVLTGKHELIIECTTGALWLYSIADRAWDFIPVTAITLFALLTTQNYGTALALDIEGNTVSVDLEALRQQRQTRSTP